jgi:hypothetical protein
MPITKVSEPSLKLVSNESNQKDTAEPRKATPIGIAAAKDSLEIKVNVQDQLTDDAKSQEQLEDDAKSMYEDSKELFKKALKTLTEMEERKKQVTDRIG